MVDCGTAEEDGPVTWEAPDVQLVDTGRRRPGDPLRRAVGSKRTGGRPRVRRRRDAQKDACPTGEAPRGQTGAEPERDRGVGGPHKSGEGGERTWHPDPAEQRRPVLRGSFRREP